MLLSSVRRTIFFSMVMVSPGAGQSLVGHIVDGVTQAPLHGVDVAILNTDLVARTEVDGSFSIDSIISGEIVVSFQAPGYAMTGMRLEISLTDNRDVSIGIVTLAPAATVSGFVFDSASRAPLRGVEVSVPELGITAESDAQGEFILDGIPSGAQSFEFRRLGYLSAQIVADLTVTGPTQVELGVVILAPTALLEAIEVLSESRQSMIMPDMMELKRMGQGHYITADEIDKLNPANISEILRRLGGFRMGGDDGIGIGSGQIQGRSFGCTTGYYVDGIRSTSASIDFLQPRAIAGIEVYDGPATIPAQYQTAGAPSCGLIVLWTKDSVNRIPRQRN